MCRWWAGGMTDFMLTVISWPLPLGALGTPSTFTVVLHGLHGVQPTEVWVCGFWYLDRNTEEFVWGTSARWVLALGWAYDPRRTSRNLLWGRCMKFSGKEDPIGLWLPRWVQGSVRLMVTLLMAHWESVCQRSYRDVQNSLMNSLFCSWHLGYKISDMATF